MWNLKLLPNMSVCLLEICVSLHYSPLRVTTHPGDPEFTEERIQEMLRHPNISFEACDKWDPDRLRRAYVNIVPGFHDDSKDAQIAVR